MELLKAARGGEEVNYMYTLLGPNQKPIEVGGKR